MQSIRGSSAFGMVRELQSRAYAVYSEAMHSGAVADLFNDIDTMLSLRELKRLLAIVSSRAFLVEMSGLDIVRVGSDRVALYRGGELVEEGREGDLRRRLHFSAMMMPW